MIRDNDLLGIAVGNFVAQLILFAVVFKEIFRTRTVKQFLRSRVLVLEALIFTISVTSFWFFLGRLFPVWRPQGCFIFHAVIMFVLELQLGLFTYVQFCRYIRTLDIPGMRKFEALLVAVFTTTTILSAYGQNVTIGLALPDSVTGTCDFTHTPAIAIADACLHAIVEFSFLAYFYRYIDAISRELAVSPASNFECKRLLQLTLVAQVLFLLWTLFLSGLNAIHSSVSLLAKAANFHPTIVVVVTGIPHLAKLRFGKHSTGNVSQMANADAGAASIKMSKVSSNTKC